MHHHRWRRAALVLFAPLLFTACGDDGSDPISLGPYGDQVTLDDGTKARVAIRAEQEIVVQWRPEGEGWTAPETIYREPDHWIHEQVELDVVGKTLAINPDYWVEKELADDFPPDHSVQVICRDLSCTEGQPTTDDSLASTQFSPDGGHAFFRTADDAAVLWNPDDGDQEVSLEGVGNRDTITLLDSGSLVAIRTESTGDACLLRVLATEGASTDFRPVAEWGPYPGATKAANGKASCGDWYDIDPNGDGVTFYADEFAEGVTFSPDGDTWTVD